MDILFEVKTPLDAKVRTTKEYWERIINVKHPSVQPFKNEVKKTLLDPDQIRRSTKDSNVNLYYKSVGKLSLCVVVDCTAMQESYIITVYLTDRIKEGDQIYVKRKDLL